MRMLDIRRLLRLWLKVDAPVCRHSTFNQVLTREQRETSCIVEVLSINLAKTSNTGQENSPIWSKASNREAEPQLP